MNISINIDNTLYIQLKVILSNCRISVANMLYTIESLRI